jgi:hypothetical protein
MDDEFRRPSTYFETEQRRLAAIHKYEQKKLAKKEQDAREFLEKEPRFVQLLTIALLDFDNDHSRKLALDAAAKDLAQNRSLHGRLSILATRAADKAREQVELEGQQALEKERQEQSKQPRRDAAESERPDYFARNEPHVNRTAPKAQWLGKYQELDDYARTPGRAKEPKRVERQQPEHVTRQQQEESDRRQTPVVEHAAREERERRPDHVGPEAGETKKAAREILERITRDPNSPNAHEPTQGHNRGGRGGRSRGR